MTVVLTLAAALMQVPPATELYGAIFYDMQVNAMIGNGNKAVTWDWWYGARTDDETEFQVRDLTCQPRSRSVNCKFIVDRKLTQAGTPISDTNVPPALRCKAQFVRNGKNDAWVVKHYPPERYGHSKTSMRCRAVKAGAV